MSYIQIKNLSESDGLHETNWERYLGSSTFTVKVQVKVLTSSSLKK